MTPSRAGWTDLRRAPDDPRPPAALVVGLAFSAQLAWSALAQAIGLSAVPGAVGVLVVAVVSSWWLTVPASVLVAVTSFLVADGFLQGQLGQLQWDGGHDALLLLALLVGCAMSAEIRAELLQEAHRRRAQPTSADRGDHGAA